MIETDNCQRVTKTSFARSGLLASLLFLAIPGIIVGTFLNDYTRPRPHREIVDINIYPWSSIGKIGITSLTTGYSCSGAVIGPNQFLTAGHCVYNQVTKRFFPAESIHFLLGYDRGEYRAHRVASRYIVPPTYVPSVSETAGDDWAVVFIEDPFPTDVRLLRLGTELPLPGTAVKTGGYPAERRHMMTADKHCNIRAVSPDGKLINHDCVVHHGDSGGPLLSANAREEGLILGFNVIAYSPMVELQEQSKEGALQYQQQASTSFWHRRWSAAFFKTLTDCKHDCGSDFRYWHLTDIPMRSADVCFEGLNQAISASPSLLRQINAAAESYLDFISMM